MALPRSGPGSPDIGEITAKIQQNNDAIHILECSLNAVKQRVARTKAQYEANCARFLKYSQVLDENQPIALLDAEFSRL